MSESSSLAPREESLPVFTASQRRGRAIAWYRTPVPPAELKALHQRSNGKGLVQTLGFLAIYAGTFGAALTSFALGPWWLTVLFVLLHGTVASFLLNGVHELGHGTVFRTKGLNGGFCRVFAFLGFLNHEHFQASHLRHHRFTLHPPDDLEVVLPQGAEVRAMIVNGFFNRGWFGFSFAQHWRAARRRFAGEWEHTLFPAGDPDRATPTVQWARVLLVGHALIAVVAIASGWWIVPILLTLAPFTAGWLHTLCNSTQHIGMEDHVADFRRCCRTFTVNPVVRVLYWHMNYHIEHHMFAAVPCYNLGKLHRLIRHDLPPCPHGLVATWREIFAILRRQGGSSGGEHSSTVPARGEASACARPGARIVGAHDYTSPGS